MVRSPSYAGVILAAGASSRMGSDKALLPWPPQTAANQMARGTFLSETIRSLLRASDFVLVVGGVNHTALASIVYTEAASLIINSDPLRGQFSSLQIGLQAVLDRGRDAAIVTLVDRPPANDETIKVLQNAFQTANDAIWSVVPEYSGTHGHPIVVGREMIEALLKAPVTSTGQDVNAAHRNQIQYVPVNDPSVALNINTPEDYQALLQANL